MRQTFVVWSNGERCSREATSLFEISNMFSPEYVLGLFFILLVALIWAASSVVAQFVYGTDSFDSPFLLTYIGVSLFTLWLPIKFSTSRLTSGGSADRTFTRNQDENDVLLDDSSYRSVEAGNEESEMTVAPPRDQGTSTLTEQQQQHRSLQNQLSQWTENDHLWVALRIAPVWFLANWSYNASLLYTSITSSTVLASTSSLFTFLFAVWVKDESFSWIRLTGVLLGVSGGVLTALHDASDRRRLLRQATDNTADASSSDDALALLGDLLGLLSAMGYGAYAVQTRVYCPKDESLYSMQLLLGYIGLLNMVLLSPIAIYLLISSGTAVEWFVVGCVVLKGLFDNFLSDYLWLRSVLLTNATVATVGLGLTIPLAFGSDLAMGKPNVFTFSSLVGATTVLVGFILVNIGTEDDNSPIEANLDENSPMELSTRATSEEIDFNSADSAETRTIS